ncbi:MAG: hypothetical protein K2N18_05175, partial [Clostridia bacterium]|nr:hypothetical protein [Clostridia bacterium]
MISFSISKQEYENDLLELVRLFEGATDEELALSVDYEVRDNSFAVRLTSDKFNGFQKNFYFPVSATNDELMRKRVEKRYLKVAIYRTLCFLS